MSEGQIRGIYHTPEVAELLRVDGMKQGGRIGSCPTSVRIVT
jgi:hypothetical protein